MKAAVKTPENRREKSKTHGADSVFEDLGFSPEESVIFERRTELVDLIIACVRKLKYNRRDLEKKLDEPQPRISELMRGKIARFSVEKLLRYCDRLEIPVGFQLLRARPK